MDNVLQTPSSRTRQVVCYQRSKTPPNKAALVLRLAERGFAEPAVLLSCGESYRKLRLVNDFTMAQAFSRAWTCQPLSKARIPQVAICHVDGIVKKVYKDLVWFPADFADPSRMSGFVEMFRHNPTNLWAFSGNEALQHQLALVGMDLTEELTQRGMANPVRYVNCHAPD
jgi:hypothetical protein